MRRLLLLTIGFTLTLCLAPGASASLSKYLSPDKDLVALKRGRGVAVLKVRGVIYGSFVHGRIRITDLPAGVTTTIRVYGAERIVKIDYRTKVYIGDDVGFRIERGAWAARIAGRGINASAVLKGTMTLSRGLAGTYSIEGGAARKWPWVARTFHLGD